MSDTTPYTVPKEPGRGRAAVLAVLVHLALFAFLWIGVSWQSETPSTIEAEVWSPDQREAAPQPEPKPEPKPEPPKPAPPVEKEPPKPEVKAPPVEKQPDIALEREKKRKEELEKKRQEEERQAKLKKAEEERQARLREEKEREAKKKAEEERIAKEEARKKEEAKKKAIEEAKRKKEEAEAKALDKMREENLRRMTEGVVGSGGAGKLAQSQGGRADAGYAARVGAKIKSNITFNVPEGLSSNPEVEYRVDLLPDGSIAGIRKLKSSGVPGFDEAVQRAIEKSQPYPKDKSGSVPSSFIGAHRPKDQ